MIYNVKTVESMIGRSRSTIWSILRAKGIKKEKGQYNITPELLDLLSQKPEKGLSAKIKRHKKYGVSHHIVRNVASRLSISINSDEMDKAMRMYKTKEYTILGIKKRL